MKHMEQPSSSPRNDRLLPWIAAERAFRAVVLAAVGIVLVTHPHTEWGREITHLAQKLGLNPDGNWVRKLIAKVRRLHTTENVLFGSIALGYALLEGAEAYGLWKRTRWGEWLTVIATSLLLIPEAWELSKGASLLKVGALLVNLAVVAYLIWRMRRHEAAAAEPLAAGGR